MEARIENESPGGFRLSPQQRRVWVLSSFDGPLAYCAQHALYVEGEVETGRLAAAVEAVASRYEILRTAFRCVPGMSMPLQVVGGAMPPSLEVRDLPSVNPDGSETDVEELLGEIGRSAFDLEAGPLLRILLVRRGSGSSMLVLHASALCLDGVGLDRVLQEVAAAYTGIQPDDEPLQYADLSEWQNGLLESEDSVAEREAWRQRDLSALSARLPFEIPASGPSPFEPRRVAREIEPDLAAAIEGLSARTGVGTECLLFAVWGVLLARLAKRSEIVIGVRFDGRSYEGLEIVPGLLARVLPMRFRYEESWSFPRLLRQVSQELSEVREAQEYFSWESSGARFAPFSFEFDEPGSGFPMGTARLVPFRESFCIDRFTVMFGARWGADSHRLEIGYDPGALDVEDARRLAAQLDTLLRRLAVSGDDPVGKLDVLSEEERQQLLVEVNEERLVLTEAKCVHRLFEEQAALAPERSAVVWEDRTLTYGELNACANRLAKRLLDLGIGPDDRVALCLERSHESVVALLAVLKAGGAYLPLDPLQPRQRLTLLLEESEARVLVTQEQFLALFPEPHVPVLCLDSHEDLSRMSLENPAGGAQPENLAYVLFTSGSTGLPKGVAVEHRQLLNYVVTAMDRLDLPPGGSFATVSTLAADLGNTMIFPALCMGGCLHIVSSERISDPEGFAEYVANRGIDCLKIVPSHLQALLTGSCPARALPRRRLILGGDALSWELAGRVRELKPECAIFNHYGPTETTVGVLACPVPDERQWALAAMVPLGRPMANSQIYLLDDALRPVPTWVPGELYVGGMGLARGYLRHPELTSARFVPHPFGGPGDRLYRTGDLARWLPNGMVEFLGRVDGQVKIRGFRVETGEVEAMLRQYPSVREAVVLARRDDQGEPRLVAYVVTDRPQPPAGELRSHLAERLPEPMVPSTFVFLKSLPLNANGKVDRSALPAPDAASPELHSAFVAPATETERLIAEIWQELLGKKRVGATDDFFALGGHSLLGVQLISRLRETFQVEIPMRRVFDETTVRRLAGVVEETILQEIGQLSEQEAEQLLDGAI